MLTEDQLISYKQNYTNQEFQWIKTPRPELLGKVVKCRDVDIINGQCVATFDDGSSCPIKEVNSNLMMIHGEMQPLSMNEVQSIYGPRPDEKPPSPKAPPLPGQAATPQAAPPPPAENPFKMFNSDEVDLNLKVKIKMPNKKLLKMMYDSAEDKQVFIDQLSNYVASMINNTVVGDSISKMLDPKAIRKEAPKEENPEVKVTEVK